METDYCEVSQKARTRIEKRRVKVLLRFCEYK